MLYWSKLEWLPPAQGFHQFSEGESPLDFLQNATQYYATAIKFKAKDASLHFRLAMVLEEKYFAEDMFGLKKAEVSNTNMAVTFYFAEDMFGLKKAKVIIQIWQLLSILLRTCLVWRRLRSVIQIWQLLCIKKQNKSYDGNILSTAVLGTLFCKLTFSESYYHVREKDIWI